MKTWKSLAFGAVLSLAVGGQADLINGANYVESLTNPDSERDWIETTKGLDAGTLTYLNKYETDDASWENDGELDAMYFGASVSEDGYFVRWDLADSGFRLDYVLVKAGNDGLRLYEVSKDQIISSFGWQEVVSPDRRGISHVSFFGSPHTQVPDAGTSLLLLSAGLLGLGALRRKLK